MLDRASSRDLAARAVFHANQRYATRRPSINVELARVCAQLRVRTMRKEVQASIAVSRIFEELER